MQYSLNEMIDCANWHINDKQYLLVFDNAETKIDLDVLPFFNKLGFITDVTKQYTYIWLNKMNVQPIEKQMITKPYEAK